MYTCQQFLGPNVLYIMYFLLHKLSFFRHIKYTYIIYIIHITVCENHAWKQPLLFLMNIFRHIIMYASSYSYSTLQQK